MKSFSYELARFAVDAKFEDLPDKVIHEAKRILLDSLACGLVGAFCDRGKYSIGISKRLGGTPESSIIGIPEKVSCSSAAFANGELMNAMDYDAFEIPPGHFPPFVIPPSLAVAESVGASGKDLMLATVIGHELGSRIGAGLTPQKGRFGENKSMVVLASGQSFFIFGGVIAAGKLLNLDSKKMTHAIGIAGHFCPVPNNRKFQITAPSPMSRLTGWVSQAAVMAALLAESGYLGDVNVFDGEFGFWRMYAYDSWGPDKVIDRIGKEWFFLNVGYKPYPCHRAMNTAMDCFIKILEINKFEPEDIDKVRVFCNPSVMAQPASSLLTNHVDAQSNIEYNFACAANRISIEEWQSSETMKNPEVLTFMKKIVAEGPPDWKERVKKNPKSRWSGGVEVKAKGKTYYEEGTFPWGTAFTDFEMTDGDLVDKFKRCASKVLDQEKINRVVEHVLELEKVENVGVIMEQLTGSP